jgi:hypothetical protein
MLATFVYLFLSGFLIWFIQKQKIFERVFFNDFLKELRKCGICLGFWVCLLLQPIFHLGLLNALDYNLYTHVVNMIVTAAVSSFIIHLAVNGYIKLYGWERI